MLEEYDRVIPGLGQKMVEVWAHESRNQQELAKQLLGAQVLDMGRARDEARFGQILGFLIAAIALIGGTLAVLAGSPWAGSLTSVSCMAGLVTAFIKGRSGR